MKKEQPIFSDKYYLHNSLTKNIDFKKDITKFRKDYVDPYCRRRYGKPIEKFTSKDLSEWSKKAPIEYDKKMDEISEKYSEYKIDKEWLTSYIFFKRIKGESLFSMEIDYNQKTGRPKELKIIIFPYTRKRHITNRWHFVERLQKNLEGYMPENKEWKTFERDKWIYELSESGQAYKQIEQILKETNNHLAIVGIKSALKKYKDFLKRVSNEGDHQKNRYK